jgi:Rieske Fe-S protein
MQRRDFIKSSCTTCLLTATGWMLPAIALTGCGPAAYQVLSTVEKEDRIEVPADAFIKGPLVLLRPKGWFYSIALRKHEDNTYSALLLKCTHQDNQLTAFSDGYSCSLHGSAYNKEGRVTKGPAERALKTFPVTSNANQLIIHTKA